MIPREEWRRPSRLLGRRVLVYDRLDSTNTLAATLAQDPANDGIIILADEQTTGRGQHGRSWSCPSGQGVLMSVLLFPPPALRRPVLLAAWAANSVCETILACIELEATIKWPNDVLIEGKKVCGILIEQGRGTVVGLGLNVNQTAEFFESAGLPQAGSLALCSGRTLDRVEVTRELIRQLDEEYCRLQVDNGDSLESRWKRRTGLLGKEVVVECQDATYRGRLVNLSWDGLEMKLTGGENLRLVPETVKHVTAV
jgi:BirA family biotin operon repressor/biotin-[acetyl-CoA-carboxylase] ligase